MNDNNQSVHIGDGVADKAKATINNRTSEIVDILFNLFFDYIKNKTKDIPQMLQKLLNDSETKNELTRLLSNQLSEKGFVPKTYAGLPDNLLVHNLRQEGYIDGVYAGYILAMMSLVDYNADKKMILSVRDDIRNKLVMNNRNNIKMLRDQYKTSTYNWVETLKQETF